jgi:2'-5' RNA ligase
VSDGRARLFVALELPDAAREALVAWRVLVDPGGLRHVEPESLHVTLCFLGLLEVSEIEPIGAAVADVGADGPMPLALDAPTWLPPRRPNVLAVGVADPTGALAAVQASLSAALSGGGWYAPEARRFLAHVTVARVRRGARVRPVQLPPPPPVAFEGELVTLFRSRTDPHGARYEPLRRVAL